MSADILLCVVEKRKEVQREMYDEDESEDEEETPECCHTAHVISVSPARRPLRSDKPLPHQGLFMFNAVMYIPIVIPTTLSSRVFSVWSSERSKDVTRQRTIRSCGPSKDTNTRPSRRREQGHGNDTDTRNDEDHDDDDEEDTDESVDAD
jgi:hypothetical protein